MAGAADVGLLIVNGDDFGLTPGDEPRASSTPTGAGILRSTSMLAVAPAFDLAAALATSGDADGLGIGAHLALVGEDPPLLGAGEVPTLVDRRGDFPRSWREFLRRVAARRVDPADVRRELSAQLDRIGWRRRAADPPRHPPAPAPVAPGAGRRDRPGGRAGRPRAAGARVPRRGPGRGGRAPPGGAAAAGRGRQPGWPRRTGFGGLDEGGRLDDGRTARQRSRRWAPGCPRAARRSWAATPARPTTPSGAATAGVTTGPTSWRPCALAVGAGGRRARGPAPGQLRRSRRGCRRSAAPPPGTIPPIRRRIDARVAPEA